MELDGFQAIGDILRSGVYALAHRGVVVYVGKSKGMLSRIYTHRSMWSAARKGQAPKWIPVKGILFDEVFIRPCASDKVDALEREMINRYKPKYNEKLKTQEKITAPIDIVINGVALRLNEASLPSRSMERRI